MCNKTVFQCIFESLLVVQRWAGHVPRMGATKDAFRVLLGKPVGRRQLERPRRKWKDNIKMDLREVGRGHGLDRSNSG